jgi:hypothetical protein
MIDDEAITLDSLGELAHELDEIERRRAELVSRRDTMIRALRHTTSASRIGKITGLSNSGIYKIETKIETKETQA